MCSVIGFSGEFNPEIIERVLDESRCRGVHAFGYSLLSGDSIQTKRFLDFSKFKDSLLMDAPSEFVAHFRYSTSGDWSVEENNQPLESLGMSLVFNGVISQKSKTEMEEEFGVEMPYENDGFVLAKFLSEGTEPPLGSTYACCYIKDGSVYAKRNRNRPLYIVERDGFSLVASTRDILKRAGIEDCEEIASEVRL